MILVLVLGLIVTLLRIAFGCLGWRRGPWWIMHDAGHALELLLERLQH